MLQRHGPDEATPEWRGSYASPPAPLIGLQPATRPVPGAGAPEPAKLLRRVIRMIDRFLRRLQGVFEFTSHPQCLLRIAMGRTREALRLADGEELPAGARFADLHLWNEHLPPPQAGGPNFAWVKALRQQVVLSLGELAAYAEADPAMQDVAAFRARVAFAGARRQRKMVQIARRLGFERAPGAARPPPGRVAHDFLDDIWLVGLIWTFNPRALRGHPLARRRNEFWISRSALITRFGSGASRPR